MDDLLTLSLHSYETIRRLAAKCILKMMKRWPSTISKFVQTLGDNLRNPSLPENAVLGSCAVLSSRTVFKRLTTDRKALPSFILGILFSSHNESQKAQKAITELFVKYNVHFAGLSRSIFGVPGSNADGTDFADLVAEICSMGFESTNLHWRYKQFFAAFCTVLFLLFFAHWILLVITIDSQQHLDAKVMHYIILHRCIHNYITSLAPLVTFCASF
jgi:proteasome activator subunit 4